MNTLKIEKGIPIPERLRGRWSRMISGMEVGDSVCGKKNEVQAMQMSARALGYKTTWRYVDQGIFRLWLLEKPAPQKAMEPAENIPPTAVLRKGAKPPHGKATS